MKKLQELFDEIIKIEGVNKDKVLSWADDIKPRFKGTAVDDGFVLNYAATFLIQSVSQNNQVMERITMFLTAADRYDSEPVFDTDVIHNGKIDLQLQINLEEQGDFVANENGQWLVNGVKCDLVYQGFDVLDDTAIGDFDGAGHVEN
jgi:hypothetical protein